VNPLVWTEENIGHMRGQLRLSAAHAVDDVVRPYGDTLRTVRTLNIFKMRQLNVCLLL